MTPRPPGSGDLTIRCSCGALRGVAQAASARSGNHAVCYCDDCQAFAHFLTRPSDILDTHGGTDIFQMSPANLTITAGAERLACMRLTQRGLLRWYTSCCNTPIGNTLPTNRLPFVGLIHLCIEKRLGDSASSETVLGPVQVRGFRRFAKGDLAAIPADIVPLPLAVLRFVGLMLRWKLRGDGKRSPFFEPASGRPVVSPRVLSATEHADLRRAVGRSS